jgi:hypothetical protein
LEGYIGLVCSEQGICNFDNQQPGNGDYTSVDIPDREGFDTGVWDNSSQAKRTYEALTIVGDYRPSAKLSLFGNYTYSTLKGNYDEGASGPLASELGDYPSSRDEAAAVPFGKLYEDITHRLVSGAVYNLDFQRAGNLALGGLALLQSGAVWNRRAQVPRSCIPGYVRCQGRTYTHYFDGWGHNRLGTWWRADLSARYRVPIRNKVDFWVKVSAINVTNEAAPVAFDEFATTFDDSNGVPTFVPLGNCPDEPVARLNCADGSRRTGFGATRNDEDYQAPRTWLLTVGLQW